MEVLLRYPFLQNLVKPLVALRRRLRVSLSYEQWINIQRSLENRATSAIAKHVETMTVRPVFGVIVDVRNGEDAHSTMESIRKQSYENWNIFFLDKGNPEPVPVFAENGNVGKTASHLACDYLVFVAGGDQLSSRALYEFASLINASPEIDMIYADEDRLGPDGRRIDPFFKPDWSPDYLETFNYVGVPACFRTKLAQRCLPSESYYDFVLRFTEHADRIAHVEKVLCHRSSRSRQFEHENGARALAERLRRTGRSGIVTERRSDPPCYRMAVQLKSEPLVSIVIPTAGKIVRLKGLLTDLILNCVSKISAVSTYKNIEFVIVDNGNIEKERKEQFEKYGCRFVTYTAAEINIAKKLNLGVGVARGDMLLLLNDDIEPITADWIEQMLMQFEKPHVGVVGAKLLYPNDKIQHAGVVHNRSKPDHVRRLYHRGDDGYFFSTSGVRNFIAVTGACMMTRRSIYRSVGGFSEELAISFNDVDYCMKVRACGYQVVYTPHAELYHFESKSRSLSVNLDEMRCYHTKWSHETIRDPFYNERCLTVAPPTFEISFNPRSV